MNKLGNYITKLMTTVLDSEQEQFVKDLALREIEKLVSLNNDPKIMILMFQKEFAERLIANDLNSINSLFKCFFKIKLKFNVSKNCFRPIPKVESSVLIFEKLRRSLISKSEIESFIKFKRNSF